MIRNISGGGGGVLKFLNSFNAPFKILILRLFSGYISAFSAVSMWAFQLFLLFLCCFCFYAFLCVFIVFPSESPMIRMTRRRDLSACWLVSIEIISCSTILSPSCRSVSCFSTGYFGDVLLFCLIFLLS